MILLVDVGNSAVKWACYASAVLQPGGRFFYQDHGIEKQLDAAWCDLPRPSRIVVAQVAGDEVAAALTQWTRAHWSLSPEFIKTSAEAAGIHNAYAVAEGLGVDRWAALVAAHHHYEGAVCVVDAGTAITIDMLAANGQHLGGVILPGIGVMKTVLLKDTAMTLAGLQRPAATASADNTADAIHGGAAYMAAAAIDRIVDDHTAVHEGEFATIITGGDADTLLTLLARNVHHDPELVLKGLARLAGGN